MGDAIERVGGTVSDKLYKALEWKVPGTGSTKLMPEKVRESLSRKISDNPHLLAAMASPVPGSVAGGIAATEALTRLARRRGLGVRHLAT